jgi:hypothetical protein
VPMSRVSEGGPAEPPLAPINPSGAARELTSRQSVRPLLRQCHLCVVEQSR